MPTLPGRNLKAAMVDPQTEWTRRRLQILLGATVTIVLTLVAGGVWSVMTMLTGGSSAGASADTGTESLTQSAQDQLADKQLPTAPLEAAQPGNLSSGKTGTIQLPPPTKVGPVDVATGFPHTPEGALHQLAAIDTTALTSASVRATQDVITQWAAPGGPTTESWSGVQAVATLLASAGMSADGAGSLVVGAEAKMGFIKGTVGDDFVIPCIDFIVTATLVIPTIVTAATRSGQPHHVAVADCQRMVWQQDATDPTHGQWVIGPGEEPAAAPSLWPGSQESFDAGYQWLEVPQ
jgi:hypothetical protein